MILKEINLANYRGFEQLDFQFHSKVTVIAGVNGVGKSGILRSLTTMFARTFHDFTPARKIRVSTKLRNPPVYDVSDIHFGREALNTSAHFTSHGESLDVVGTRQILTKKRVSHLQGRVIALRKELREAGRGKKKAELEEEIASLKRLQTDRGDSFDLFVRSENQSRTLEKLQEVKGPPIIVMFSPHRHLFDDARRIASPEPFAPSAAYTLALEDRRMDIGDIAEWLNTMLKLGGRGAKRRKAVVAQLQSIVTDFIPEFSDLRVEEKPRLRLVVEKNGTPLSLLQLSDGERGILALLFDITRRLAIANPHLDNPVADGSGLIMIDEIELHLHPKWQRDVLTRLTKTFKSCQFVVTSHSPMLLGEVKAESIRFLYHDEDRRVRDWTPDYSLGLDVNRILEDLMDVKSRDAGIAKKITDLFRKIDDEDFPFARKKLAALQKVVGDADPDLIRAKSLMEFLGDSE